MSIVDEVNTTTTAAASAAAAAATTTTTIMEHCCDVMIENIDYEPPSSSCNDEKHTRCADYQASSSAPPIRLSWDTAASTCKVDEQELSSTNSSPPRPLQAQSNDTPTKTTPYATTTTVPIRRIPSQLRLAILSLNRDQAVWEDVEDDLYILLDGTVHNLQLFKTLYFDHELSKTNNPTTSTNNTTLLLRSLAYLCSRKASDMTIHDEHVTRISRFLITGRTSQSCRRLILAALQTMMKCISPDDATWQYQDDIITGTYDFLITRTVDWEYMDHSSMTLLYEIRARCLREIDLERERIQRVCDKGNETAILIATGAKLVEIGIQKSNIVIEGHIDNAGKKVKDWVDPGTDPLIKDRDAVVVMAFSDTARRASEYAREGTKIAISSLRNASISGLYTVGNKLEEGKFTERLSPESREFLKAAGKVGMATVGAAAMVGEAVVETGRCIVKKTAGVTVDVVGHKYGTTAGEVAKNAADTADNVLQTVGNVALLEGAALAKNVTKSIGKDQIDKDIGKVKDTIQLLEEHVSKIASHTLGIEWKGTWTKELTASESNDTHDNKTTTPPTSSCKIISAVKSDDWKRIPMKPGPTVLTDKQHRPCNTIPQQPNNNKSPLGSEDHCSSETSSLSSSVSTEQSAYRIARRGKPPQRKRVPLRPDMDLSGPLSLSSSSRRRNHASNSKLSRNRRPRPLLTPSLSHTG
jgi:hypothetical protein